MDNFPVALRMESRRPASLGGMLMHAERKGGDLEHCEDDRRDETIWYDQVGPRDFKKAVKEEIEAMSKSNLDNALEAMLKNRRTADHDKRKEEGKKPPYRDAENGPLREVILTANAQYFYADPDDPDPYKAHRTTKNGDRETIYLSRDKIKAFERRGLEFFAEYFPGQLRHLRLDMDEEVPHFHALVMVTKVTISKRRGKQINIVPSANPLIKNYEWAQDAAGKFFSTIGLVRGERRAEARREAKEKSLPPPEKRKHVKPSEFRAERAKKLLEREEKANERLEEAEATYQEAFWKGENIIYDAMNEADAIRKETLELKDEAVAQLAIAEKALELKSAEFSEALEEGCNAVDDDKIRYCPPDESHDEEGLAYGPNAPKDPTSKKSLVATVQPALKVIKKYAKQIWNSEPARLERDIKADPSMVNVQVTYDREKAIQSDDILTMDVKVKFDKLEGLSKPMKRILGGIANVIATKVGKATIKLAREQMRDEFETLKSYREKCRKIFGTLPIEEQRSLLSTERKFENMTSTAPDPRDARRNRGEDR